MGDKPWEIRERFRLIGEVTMVIKMKEINKAKGIGQFRLQLNGVFQPFCSKVHYGQDVFVPGAIKEIVKLALQLHERLNGKDIPIGD